MLAKIVAVVNQKGGVGKTTVCLNLACALVKRGFRTLLVDADPQESSLKMAALATEDAPYPVAVMSLASTAGKLAQMVKLHMQNYEVIIIDGPPSATAPQTRAAVVISDLTLIPLQPSMSDLNSTITTCDLINEVHGEKDLNTPTYVVMTMLERTNMSRVILKEAGPKTGFPLMSARLSRRTSFKEAQALGLPVENYDDPLAAAEVAQLADEVIRLLSLEISALKSA